MYLVAIAWMYVVLMMAVAEATSTQGSVLGAIVTFALYGLLPLSIVIYVMGAPRRRAARRQAEAIESAQADDRGHAPAAQAADPLVAERKEP